MKRLISSVACLFLVACEPNAPHADQSKMNGKHVIDDQGQVYLLEKAGSNHSFYLLLIDRQSVQKLDTIPLKSAALGD